ncbi:hypothetical protein V8E53_009422 [Lactarius tabidus]
MEPICPPKEYMTSLKALISREPRKVNNGEMKEGTRTRGLGSKTRVDWTWVPSRFVQFEKHNRHMWGADAERRQALSASAPLILPSSQFATSREKINSQINDSIWGGWGGKITFADEPRNNDLKILESSRYGVRKSKMETKLRRTLRAACRGQKLRVQKTELGSPIIMKIRMMSKESPSKPGITQYYASTISLTPNRQYGTIFKEGESPRSSPLVSRFADGATTTVPARTLCRLADVAVIVMGMRRDSILPLRGRTSVPLMSRCTESFEVPGAFEVSPGMCCLTYLWESCNSLLRGYISKSIVDIPFDWLPQLDMEKRRAHLNLQWLDTQQTLYFHRHHPLHMQQRSVPLRLKLRWTDLLADDPKARRGQRKEDEVGKREEPHTECGEKTSTEGRQIGEKGGSRKQRSHVTYATVARIPSESLSSESSPSPDSSHFEVFLRVETTEPGSKEMLPT